MSTNSDKAAPVAQPSRLADGPTSPIMAGIKSLEQIASIAALTLTKAALAIQESAEQANREYERQLVRQAYLRRRQWKACDVRRLKSLPHARLSTKRLASLPTLPKRGRPVVQRYRPLPEAFMNYAAVSKMLFDPLTLPHKRLNALKRTPWWPAFAELLYRGTYDEIKKHANKSPAHEAERCAASQLAISADALRKLCNKIQRDRRANGAAAEPAISPAIFTCWLKTGDLPES